MIKTEVQAYAAQGPTSALARSVITRREPGPLDVVVRYRFVTDMASLKS